MINDLDVMRRFTLGLTRLGDKGQTAKVSEPIKQLSRRTAAVALTAPQSTRLTPPALYERVRRSVLIVGATCKCTKCTKWHVSGAGGFAIAPDVIATNYHVVANPDRRTLGAMRQDHTVYAVKDVLAADKAADVALLRVQGPPLVPLPLRPGSPVGTAVWVLSHPSGRYYTFTEGMLSRRFRHGRGPSATDRIAITADYAKGSSGAPVLDATGAVVGMVASTSSIYYKKIGVFLSLGPPNVMPPHAAPRASVAHGRFFAARCEFSPTRRHRPERTEPPLSAAPPGTASSDQPARIPRAPPAAARYNK